MNFKPLFSILILFTLNTKAQKQIPEYGKIDKTDLELKDCDFEKGAEAMVLFDVAEVFCDRNLNSNYNPLTTEMERHVRIKILNTKGTDVANIKIRYLSDKNIEDIKSLSAQTINIDDAGNIVIIKVEKDAIYRKKINKRYSEVIFTFPQVKPGSIIEYKYKDAATDLYAVKNWYFQKSIPVAFSRYILNFPNELVVSAIPKGGLQVNMSEKNKTSRIVKTFTMSNVPALKDEAYISCDEDYLQQVTPLMVAVDFPGSPRRSLLRTWPGIIKELMEDEDFRVQLKKNIPRTKDLDALLSTDTDPYKKMVIIHDYVKKNMLWDEAYSIWALDGVKSAWRDKKGTAGEINLILVNLLKDADLNAHPVLVSTRDNGRVNTGIAGYDQFDKVMAYVTINENNYVLDATDKHTPANLIPYDVANTEGLVIEKIATNEWGWKTLWNPKNTFNNTTFLNVEIDDKGKMNGAARVTSSGYSRIIRLNKLKEGKEKFTEAWLNTNKDDIKIDSLAFTNESIDSLPLIQDIKFEKKISSSGDYNYFSANLFSGLDKNPFIAEQRFSDIFFGANQKYAITGNFFIPENYEFEALPKNIKMMLPDTSVIFIRAATITDNMLSVRIVLEFMQPVYSYQDYDYFREFYKKMFEMLNEQFVFKKK
jgi:Domain of Unknown Function with PDB structure (DUF3857)